MKVNVNNDNNINLKPINEQEINFSINDQEINSEINISDSVNFGISDSEEITFGIASNYQGTGNYNSLSNKPQINDVVLIGNKSSEQLHLQDEMDYLTNNEIEQLLDNFV